MRLFLILIALIFGCAHQPDFSVLEQAEHGEAKISEYTTASSPATDDYLLGVDVSDTSMASSGTTKKFTISSLPYESTDPTLLRQSDVDDTPVDGVTTAPVSSNWAYDHAAAADPHAGYMLESNIGTGANNYLQLSASPGTPDGTKVLRDDMTWAEVVSGDSGAPTDASYWTSTAESGLTGETNLGALSNGLLKLSVAGGIAAPAIAVAGSDYEAADATILKQADVDDTPVDGVTAAPISSNWAHDHGAAADPHAGYMLESNIGVAANNFLQLSSNPGTADGTRYLRDDMTWAAAVAPEVDDTPVDGATTTPVSSNWAYDHTAGADPHTGYMLESNIGTGASNYLQLSAAPGTPDGSKFLRDDGTWADVPDAHDPVTLATGVDALTLSTQEIGTETKIEQLADLTPTNSALLGFSDAGAIENKTSISIDMDLGVQSSTTSGRLGRNASDQITMGDDAGTGTVVFSPTDDTAGDGDTAASWSADKTYDEIASIGAYAKRYHQTAHFDPDNLYNNYGGILVLDDYTDGAITISRLHVTLNEDPTTELLFTVYFKASAIDFSGGTTVGSGTTSAGLLTVNSGWTDNTIPAGSKVWLEVGTDPDATTVHCSAALTGSYD